MYKSAGCSGSLIDMQGFEGVQTCKKNETLQAVMEKIVKAEVCHNATSYIVSHVAATHVEACPLACNTTAD